MIDVKDEKLPPLLAKPAYGRLRNRVEILIIIRLQNDCVRFGALCVRGPRGTGAKLKVEFWDPGLAFPQAGVLRLRLPP